MFEATAAGWQRTQRILPGDLFGFGLFGASVALDGTTLAVGAPDHGWPFDTGRVYVFEHLAGDWIETAVIDMPVPEDNSAFGWRVALEGDLLLVSGIGVDSPTSPYAGRVYVYRRGVAGWTLEAEIPSPPGTSSFGWALDLQEEMAAISGYSSSVADNVYFYSAAGGWQLEDALDVSGTGLFGRPGYALARDGHWLVVGEPEHGPGWPWDPSGRAVVFERVGGTWQQRQVLEPSDAQGAPYGERFGCAVDLLGDRLVVGAFMASEGSARPGSAYLFELQGGTWVETRKLQSRQRHVYQGLGCSVALGEGTALVGAYAYEVAGVQTGAALVYDLPIGSEGCTGSVNSTGAAGRLTATGSYLADVGDLTLRARDLPPGEAGLFLVSASGTYLPGAGGGAGTLCLGSPVLRLPPVAPTGTTGELELVVDLSGLPLTVLAGTELWFQGWYTDPAGAAPHNLTDSRSILFR